MNYIENLLGETKACDQIDDMIWVFYRCSKFDGNNVAINFETGIVEVQDQSGNLVETLEMATQLIKHETSNHQV